MRRRVLMVVSGSSSAVMFALVVSITVLVGGGRVMFARVVSIAVLLRGVRGGVMVSGGLVALRLMVSAVVVGAVAVMNMGVGVSVGVNHDCVARAFLLLARRFSSRNWSRVRSILIQRLNDLNFLLHVSNHLVHLIVARLHGRLSALTLGLLLQRTKRRFNRGLSRRRNSRVKDPVLQLRLDVFRQSRYGRRFNRDRPRVRQFRGESIRLKLSA